MAKKKKTNIPARFRGRLLAAAGIFAAGSLVGSALEIPPMSAYFEITVPDVLKLPDRETSVPVSGETFQTLETPVQEPSVPSVSVQENVPVPEQPSAPAPEIHPETEVQTPQTVPDVSEPVIPPQSQPDPVPDPAVPSPVQDDWMAPESDWMAGIFVPAEPAPSPEPVPAPVPEEWMETPEWQIPVSGSEAPPVPEPSSPQTSSMTEELAAMLENLAVFWSTADNKIHLDPSCPSAAVLFAGTVEEAQSVRTEGWCRRCAEHLDGTDNSAFYIKGNSYADAGRIAASYTFSDYLNGIPAEAFGG